MSDGGPNPQVIQCISLTYPPHNMHTTSAASAGTQDKKWASVLVPQDGGGGGVTCTVGKALVGYQKPLHSSQVHRLKLPWWETMAECIGFFFLSLFSMTNQLECFSVASRVRGQSHLWHFLCGFKHMKWGWVAGGLDEHRGEGGEGHGEVINGVFDTCTELALLMPFYSLKQEEDIIPASFS